VELTANALIFRNRSGAPYTKDTLGDDFRTVRNALYGKDDGRQLQDMRRSGAGEAIQGGSRAEQLSGKMANTLSASNRLFKTYVPVDVATVREVDSSREAARRKERTANKKSKDAGQTSLRKTDPKR
jgi:hypothetical protein